MDLHVRRRECPAPGESEIEVVERKGLGHPDTICDALAEHFSVRLSRAYIARVGRVLHHNVDKLLLCGGASHPAFGGGEVREPIEIFVGGRATEIEGVSPAAIAVEACKEWLRANIRELDVERDVRVISRVREGSADLRRLFAKSAAMPLANDTSVGAGFAPLTELERAVLAVEHALNSAATKREYPAIGTDVKVMGVRRHTKAELTIGCAFIGRHLRDLPAYIEAKAAARAIALAAAHRAAPSLEIDAVVNAADDLVTGDVFLTVTGTSAEAGDDGEVGRGNRVCGLITPYRPMTLEAAAGKNAVSHVGKIYNLVATRIAESVAGELARGADATCVLVSRIGAPVDDPAAVDICASDAIAPERARKIVVEQLARLDELRGALLEERLPVW